MGEASKGGLPILAFPSQAAFSAWLAEQGADAPGVWLKLAKKGAAVQGITHSEAIDAALAHGWIDGQAASLDDGHWLLRFTRRRPNSKWAKLNRERAERLIASGQMQPAGLREVELAKADGRWAAAYPPPSQAEVPEDLAAALASDHAARGFFDTLDAQNRFAILHRVHTAKRPETRARRIAQFVAMLARGETIYPRRAKG